MTNQSISPDDPRLTAYALGELSLEEQVQVEEFLRNDPEARAAVEQLRAFAGQMAAALKREPLPESGEAEPLLSPEDAAEAPEPVANIPGDGGPGWKLTQPRTRLLRFPQLYYVIGGLAAAAFAVMVALRETPSHEAKIYREILLNPPSQTAAVSMPKAEDEALSDEHEEVAANVPAAAAESTESGSAADVSGLANKQLRIATAEHNPENSGSPLMVKKTPALELVADVKAAIERRTEKQIDAALAAKSARTVTMNGALTTARLERAKPGSAPIYLKRGGFAYDGTYYYPPDPKFVFPVKPTPNPDEAMLVAPSSRGLAFDVFPALPRSATPLPLSPPNWWGDPFGPLPQGLVDAALQRGAAVKPFQPFDLFPGSMHRTSHLAAAMNSALERDNPFVDPVENPISAFAVPVSVASYEHVYRSIENGELPAPDAVRIEELLNYFPYSYGAVESAEAGQPFHVAIEMAAAPWEPTHQLVRIGVHALASGAHRVKLAIQFNSDRVASYRLIGYENRTPPDTVVAQDQGSDMRAGSTVTALFEIVPSGVPNALASGTVKQSSTIGTVRISFAEPASIAGRELNLPVTETKTRFADASDDFKFAAAVTEYGMMLRRSPYRGTASMGDVIAWATAGTAKPGDDPLGRRRDFIDLARRTEALMR